MVVATIAGAAVTTACVIARSTCTAPVTWLSQTAVPVTCIPFRGTIAAACIACIIAV